MRCFATADKHRNDNRAIARQTPITKIGGLLEVMFSVGFAPTLYGEDPRPAETLSEIIFNNMLQMC
jgi:hypothetical protein